MYVNHHTYDYDGNLIKGGEDCTFVESLTHNSIIVQIPLLHGHVNNRLEQVLSVFNQSNASKGNPQTIAINDDAYMGDPDMEYILKRLLSAASNPEVRQEMNVEDEFFKAIEDRDTAIMVRDRKIDEQDRKIDEQDRKIDEQDRKMDEQERKIDEQKRMLQNAIGGLRKQGMDDATIASILGLPEGDFNTFE